MRLVLSLGLDAKISLLPTNRVKVNQRDLSLTAYERSESTVEAAVSTAVLEPAGATPAATETYGTMGADSRDALGVDACCGGSNFDLPTSSIRLVAASFTSASGT